MSSFLGFTHHFTSKLLLAIYRMENTYIALRRLHTAHAVHNPFKLVWAVLWPPPSLSFFLVFPNTLSFQIPTMF